MGSVSIWEAIFMLVVLKIPLVYMGVVVWWAIRSEPAAGEHGEPELSPVPVLPCGWNEWRRRRGARGGRPLRPLGGPLRARARVALASRTCPAPVAGRPAFRSVLESVGYET